MSHDDVCRECGCTEDRACPGGCHWVKPGLCSACELLQLTDLVETIVPWLKTPSAASSSIDAILCGRPATISKEQGPALVVRDHLGIKVFHMDARTTEAGRQYEIADIKAMFENLMKGAVLFQ